MNNKPERRYAWTLLVEEQDQRVFRDQKSNRIAIGDQSGYWPEDTNDGVLWLDVDTPIMYLDGATTLPVKDNNGEAYKVVIGKELVPLFMNALGMSLNLDNKLIFRVNAPTIKL